MLVVIEILSIISWIGLSKLDTHRVHLKKKIVKNAPLLHIIKLDTHEVQKLDTQEVQKLDTHGVHL